MRGIRGGAQGDGHDRADKRENHLGLHLDDILGQEEDRGADLTRDGDGVFGILGGVLREERDQQLYGLKESILAAPCRWRHR